MLYSRIYFAILIYVLRTPRASQSLLRFRSRSKPWRPWLPVQRTVLGQRRRASIPAANGGPLARTSTASQWRRHHSVMGRQILGIVREIYICLLMLGGILIYMRSRLQVSVDYQFQTIKMVLLNKNL